MDYPSRHMRFVTEIRELASDNPIIMMKYIEDI